MSENPLALVVVFGNFGDRQHGATSREPDDGGSPLRKILLGTAGACAFTMAGALTPADAISLDPTAVRPAIDAVNPVEKASCWQYGWHGWGWYPCGYYYYGGPYWGRHPEQYDIEGTKISQEPKKQMPRSARGRTDDAWSVA